MAQIIGPNGQVVKVDASGRLCTFAVSEPEDKHLNQQGVSNSLYFSVTPAGANDYFFYLMNTGLSDLDVTDIRVSSSVPTTVFYEHVIGTPSYVSETEIVPVNRNLGSAKTLDITANYDTDITGLTSQGVLFFEELPIAATLYHLRSTSNIIIPQGKAIAFRREAATGTMECLVSVVESIN